MRIRPSKLFSTIFLIAVLSSITFSQTGKPELLGRFSGGDILEFNYLISQKYFGSNFGSDSRLVLRICSDKGLLDAIALGAGMFTTASEKEYGLRLTFDRYGLSKTKILYAVYSGCESGKSTFKTVEYWVVPNGAKLEVDDEITAKEIRITANTPHSNREFLAAIRDAGSSPNTAAKFFVGAYNKRPSDQLRQNMKKAQDFLKDESEPWKFEFVQIEADIGDPEPEFPATIIVNRIQAISAAADSCEISTAKIDTVRHSYLAARSPDTDLIIIGTKGSNEVSENINQKRIELAGKASESSPLPKVSFYVDGKLAVSITASVDSLFCTECCER